MQREIIRLGHPHLRQVAHAVSLEQLRSDEVQQLIDDMIETMRAVSGAGLAAPQVDVPLRICVAETHANPRYPSMPHLPLVVWVNPVIHVLHPKPEVVMFEGCLSVPGLRGQVRRAANIRVDFIDRAGNKQSQTFNGPLAAVAAHECDHLDGVLFVDRAATRSLTFMEEYEQFVPAAARLQLQD